MPEAQQTQGIESVFYDWKPILPVTTAGAYVSPLATNIATFKYDWDDICDIFLNYENYDNFDKNYDNWDDNYDDFDDNYEDFDESYDDFDENHNFDGNYDHFDDNYDHFDDNYEDFDENPCI